jgi:hypothetical protein
LGVSSAAGLPIVGVMQLSSGLMEHADFDPFDPPELADASLACPMCLHAVDWHALGAGARARIACRCRNCGHERLVELSGPQLLSLGAFSR